MTSSLQPTCSVLTKKNLSNFSISSDEGTSTKVAVAISYFIFTQKSLTPMRPVILYQHAILPHSTGQRTRGRSSAQICGTHQAGCTLPSLVATLFCLCGHGILPTGVVIRSDMRYDSHPSVFCYIIPSRHDFASAQTGAVIAPRLTTSSIDSNPLSVISKNPADACWSFRGN